LIFEAARLTEFFVETELDEALQRLFTLFEVWVVSALPHEFVLDLLFPAVALHEKDDVPVFQLFGQRIVNPVPCREYRHVQVEPGSLVKQLSCEIEIPRMERFSCTWDSHLATHLSFGVLPGTTKPSHSLLGCSFIPGVNHFGKRFKHVLNVKVNAVTLWIGRIARQILRV